jgi:Na+-transporting methylmalonyl-CoA/oxaloacetate decarboxylase gamma subunit
MRTMEGILSEITVGAGVFLSVLTLLVFVIGGVLLGRLAEEEKAGKRFFWAEWPLPEAEPRVPREYEALRIAA